MASDTHDLDPRARVLLRILSELESSGSEFALLHGDGDVPPDVVSDVDLAFAQPPPIVIEPILQRLSRAGELVIVQRLHYDVEHGYYYILWIPPAPLRFLHLDCLCDPLGVNRYRLPTTYLLAEAGAGPYGKRIAKRKEAVYLLMKRAVKGQISTQQLDALRGRFRDATDSVWSDVELWFGSEARSDVESLLRTENSGETGVWLKALVTRANRLARRRHPLRSMLSFLLQARRKWRRLWQPTGLFVVIVGPDGSGKSTLAESVLPRLERAFRDGWRFHWRPGLLPKLRRQSSQTDTQAAQAPAQVSKYRGAVSLARFVYYWLDFVLGYWLIIYPRKAQTTLVVAERYFPDVVVHPQRYGFSVPRWAVRVAAATVPSPDLLVILRDDPEAIFARKAELSPAKIASQLRAYQEEANHWRRSEVIDTRGGAAAVTARLADLILEECADRTARHLDQHSEPPRWRAFPGARGIKVWFGDAEVLRNSLNLYHPYSRSGRVAKFFGSFTPRPLHRLLFRTGPSRVVAARFSWLTELIRKQFADDTLTVSFSAGTPGPHRKLTAQVTRGGSVISYVKIAQDETVSALLEHEADTLAWLHREGFGGEQIPQILALEHEQQLTLLFLSSPANPGRSRPLEPDVKDARFLSGLASLGVSKTPIAEVFEWMGFDAYLEQMLAQNREAVAILQRAMATLKSRFEENGVSTSACHGDYAPWNTLRLADGSMFVIDWEYGEQRAPALTDLFHRLLMPACYLLHRGPQEVVDQLLNVPRNSVLSPVIAQSGVSPAEVPAHVLLYLLGQLVGGRHGRHEDEFMLEMIEYALRFAGDTPPRKKVLVVAYACQPGYGSEPGVGWHMCEAISREHDAWVITRRNNREGIEQALARQANPYLHFNYVDLPVWARFWKKRGRGIRLYYYLWQFAALRVAIKLARTVKFDLAHHVTFVNDYLFTGLSLQRIPFVWGPIGSPGRRPGTLWEDPRRFLGAGGGYYFKAFLRVVDPLFWLSAIRAKLVVGIDDDICKRFPISVLAKNKYVSHTAIGVEEELMARRGNDGSMHSGFEVLSMGNLNRIKGFDLSIRAFAIFARTEPSARLKIVGDGPLKQSLEKLAQDLGVADRVAFVPLLRRAAAMKLMGDADVFLFPSSEAEGMVVLEALAQGLPVVCLAHGGPGKMVTPECGFAVQVGPRAVEHLADALKTLVRDATLMERMDAAARRHIEDKYLWERRHQEIRKWYLAAGIGAETSPQPQLPAGTDAANEVGHGDHAE